MSHSTEKFGCGTLRCIRKNSGIEKFHASEGESRFSVENFLSHSTEKFRWATLRSIRKFRISKNFRHQRGGGYHVSPSKTFCHTVPKNFVGQHFGVSENFGYRIILGIREGGGYHVSPSKTFCHRVPKNFVGEHFGVSENFGYRIISCIRGGMGSRFSVENFLSHSTEKFRWATLRSIRKFRISKNCRHQRGGGGITFPRRKAFVTEYRKISLENTSVYQKISDNEKFYASERGGYHVSPSKSFCLTEPKHFIGEQFGEKNL